MDAGRICPEDVVCLVSDPNMPGMVCCVGEDTENRHAQPSAHVYWLRENDNDRMEPISELRILDRALLHGDTGLISYDILVFDGFKRSAMPSVVEAIL